MQVDNIKQQELQLASAKKAAGLARWRRLQVSILHASVPVPSVSVSPEAETKQQTLFLCTFCVHFWLFICLSAQQPAGPIRTRVLVVSSVTGFVVQDRDYVLPLAPAKCSRD